MLICLYLLLLIITNVVSEINNLDKHCTHDDHCGDFRLICSNVTNSCVCTKFYRWEPELQQCNLNLTELKEWLNSLKEERDRRAHLDKEAHSKLFTLSMSGLVAVVMGLIGALACTTLFCFFRNSDVVPQEKKVLTESEEKGKENPATEGEAMCPTVILDFASPPTI
ncbi:hypothetical protein O3M35_011808 [Rhynocoris fuscipes]|uniref:Uncharacterized protein n=1 Tax=Rhynocoris fuscipes TaxID=488301 RepID=A0AAW1D083_9HEMI